MEGAPTSSPAGDEPSTILIVFSFLPSSIGIVVIIVVALYKCCNGQCPPQQTTDLEAQNPNLTRPQQPHPHPPVNSSQRTPVNPVNSQLPPVSGPRPLCPPVVQRPEDPRIAEISRGCTECAVCFGNYAGDQNGVVRLTLKPCGHRYHKACIVGWLLKNGLCPICRRVAQDFSISVHGRHSANVDCSSSAT